MKNNKWNIIVYLHMALLLWALLFVGSLLIPGGGIVAGALAVGNLFFLLFNIPFSVFSLIQKKKNRFSEKYNKLIIVLSILNMIVAIDVWCFLILLCLKP